MQVKCQSFSEFLDCLGALVSTESLFNSAVRFSQITKKSGPVSDEVYVNFTTVVREVDGAEYLLSGGEFCGTDYRDSGGDLSGTRRAAECRASLVEFCTQRNWIVLPGTIEI